MIDTCLIWQTQHFGLHICISDTCKQKAYAGTDTMTEQFERNTGKRCLERLSFALCLQSLLPLTTIDGETACCAGFAVAVCCG